MRQNQVVSLPPSVILVRFDIFFVCPYSHEITEYNYEEEIF